MDVTHYKVLVFFVNGKKIVEDEVNPEWNLLYYLRNKLRLCGSKLGCSEGGCGSCTVMMSRYNWSSHKIEHVAINACITPLAYVHGYAITTVEGIRSIKSKLHPVQERIAKWHGTQCGFCTPGMVMSMYTLLRQTPQPTMKDIQTAFQGNLCRCTGYRTIIEGYKTFTKEYSCSMGEQCCKLQNKLAPEVSSQEASLFAPADETQEPIFPPELKLNPELSHQNLLFKSEELSWYRPVCLEQLLFLKNDLKQAKLVAGGTDVLYEMKTKKTTFPIMIQTTEIPEMKVVQLQNEGVAIGSAVTLEELQIFLEKIIEEQPETKTRFFKELKSCLRWFGALQIRNVATLAGNIITASPISDLNALLIAGKATLELRSLKSSRKVVIDKDFFTGYHSTVLKPQEVLVSIFLPYSKQNEHFFFYKQSRRREEDISIVNCGVRLETTKENSTLVKDIEIVFGGVSSKTVTAEKTKKFFVGKQWNEPNLQAAFDLLLEDFSLALDAPGGMVNYRKSLVLGLFFKSFLSISSEIREEFNNTNTRKTVEKLDALSPSSSQYFSVRSRKENEADTIGLPQVHLSAFKHATGEATFCDDLPKFQGELHMGLLLSAKAHAKIVKIDAAKALAMEGVHAFFSAKDIEEGRNAFGPMVDDDEVFVSDIVTAHGQVLGAIVADDQILAQKALRKVEVTYSELRPVVISIEDAIKHDSFFPGGPKLLQDGNVDGVFKSAKFILEGDVRTGAQEHFYIEPQSVIAVPKNEDEEMDIYCTSQYPSQVSNLVSKLLGVPQNRITTKVKRVGGGFGGKETKTMLIILPAALAASKLLRPIRCTLFRDEDMLITAGRHPSYSKYKVAFDENGRILAFEVWIYINGGCSHDISHAAIDRAMFHCENAFKIANMRVHGYICKTNLPSNTAFRGTGAPQAMLIADNMIRQIAEFLNKDILELSKINLYQEGDMTHYKQRLDNCTLERCWDECLERSKFEERQRAVEEFNKENRWKKRGITMVPTKFGVGFDALHLNQAGALVHIYTDGSVLLYHGGVEMGQGTQTKMVQVASRVLGIPTSLIYTNETSTDKVPNMTQTAASVSSDLNGMAVMNACQVLADRLEPYRTKNPEKTWKDWVSSAYFDRVSLSSTGFYSTPDMGYDWKTMSGNMYNYFSYGAACSEVEIDVLTGEHRLVRTDIVMDVGESLNPSVDIGQIEGAFVQGYGLYVLEEKVFLSDGTLFTVGPSGYKIPGFTDIPAEFNVSLLKGAPNPRAIYSSKAIGEPPLYLASSIFFAIREAVKSARKDGGVEKPFVLYCPATCERIRMACNDHITEKVEEKSLSGGTTKPWNVVP